MVTFTVLPTLLKGNTMTFTILPQKCSHFYKLFCPFYFSVQNCFFCFFYKHIFKSTQKYWILPQLSQVSAWVTIHSYKKCGPDLMLQPACWLLLFCCVCPHSLREYEKVCRDSHHFNLKLFALYLHPSGSDKKHEWALHYTTSHKRLKSNVN